MRPITSKWLKIDLYSSRKKCIPKNLVFSDVSFMAIFAELTENEYIINRHVDTLRDSLVQNIEISFAPCGRAMSDARSLCGS